jgi:hypothetical protein
MCQTDKELNKEVLCRLTKLQEGHNRVIQMVSELTDLVKVLTTDLLSAATGKNHIPLPLAILIVKLGAIIWISVILIITGYKLTQLPTILRFFGMN